MAPRSLDNIGSGQHNELPEPMLTSVVSYHIPLQAIKKKKKIMINLRVRCLMPIHILFLLFVSGHETAAVLLPGFAINW